ncbi:MAG: signal transduction histidine kinase [Acidimicrobiales bacterium]
MLLGGIALWLAVGSALEPVSRISAEARAIDSSTSGGRLEVPRSGDEIAELTVTLNAMLDRLDAGLRRQRQFVSDASHELRSPLTVVKGAGELVASDIGLPVDLRSPVATLNRNVLRLESVLDDLTALAAAGAAVSRTDVDLADLVIDEVAATEAAAEHSAVVSIDVTGVRPVVVSAYPVRLGRAVRNLLDNAVRYAESLVVVTTEVIDGTVRITVDDDGPGVPAADRESVFERFERFVRLDAARHRDRGGSGLGLAIVATIAEDHGGSVVCDVGPRGGARFVLSFPE